MGEFIKFKPTFAGNMKYFVHMLVIVFFLMPAISCRSNKGPTNKLFYSKNKPSRVIRKEHIEHSKKVSKRNDRRLKKLQQNPRK